MEKSALYREHPDVYEPTVVSSAEAEMPRWQKLSLVSLATFIITVTLFLALSFFLGAHRQFDIKIRGSDHEFDIENGKSPRSIAFNCPIESPAPLLAHNSQNSEFRVFCQPRQCSSGSKPMCVSRKVCKADESLEGLEQNSEAPSLCCRHPNMIVSKHIRPVRIPQGSLAMFQNYSSGPNHFGDIIHRVYPSPNDRSEIVMEVKHYQCPRTLPRIKRDSRPASKWRAGPEKVMDDGCPHLWGPQLNGTPWKMVVPDEQDGVKPKKNATKSKYDPRGKSDLCGIKVGAVLFPDIDV